MRLLLPALMAICLAGAAAAKDDPPPLPLQAPSSPYSLPSPSQSTKPADTTSVKRKKTPENAKSRDNANGLVSLELTAMVTESGPVINTGLIWRIYDSHPGADGHYKLVSTLRQAAPVASLPAGDYLINAAYGLSNLTKRISVQQGAPGREQFVLNTGGLRLGAVLSDGQPISPTAVRYDVYDDETDQFGNRTKVLTDARPGVIIRLNAGAYHIVSVYGDANAIVRADVTVEPGRLTEATVHHSAAKVTFRLVQHEGGEAMADTQWSVVTPGGDIVKESAGALPTHILAAGDYSVLARHNGQIFSQDFTIESGDVKQVEVVTR